MITPLLEFYRYPWDPVGGIFYHVEDNVIPWTLSGLIRHSADNIVFHSRQNNKIALDNGAYLLPMPSSNVPLKISASRGICKQTFIVESPLWLNEFLSNEHQQIQNTDLYRSVASWSAFFDECYFDASARTESTLSWSELSEKLEHLEAHDDEPQMSLIVRVAEELTPIIRSFFNGLHTVLTHDRRMLPAGKATEFDTACLDWYIQQPGITAAAKAASNQQRLKAIAHTEFVNTLENRVLKDFLSRCCVEADIYRSSCKQHHLKSSRAHKVQTFKTLCSSLLALPVFGQISSIAGLIQPNYVLQGDPRYRKIWARYRQLLRKQRVYDRIWTWQSRLWSDATNLMISVALERMQKQAQEKQGWILEETAASLPHFFSEQHEGLRLERNFSQGPFLLRTPDNKRLIAVDVLSTTGGHAYFRHRLNNPLEKLRKASGWSAILCTDLLRHKHTAIVFWPIHASASGGVDEALLDNIKGSMRALVLRQLPRMTATHKMDYYSIALLSDKSLDANLGSEEVRAIRLGIGVTEWSSNINFLANLLKELFDEVVK